MVLLEVTEDLDGGGGSGGALEHRSSKFVSKLGHGGGGGSNGAVSMDQEVAEAEEVRRPSSSSVALPDMTCCAGWLCRMLVLEYKGDTLGIALGVGVPFLPLLGLTGARICAGE
eukprot:CAMPEP_0113596464 /NCGR_PEP_ID=MMETSP0015_2-20120614/40347_1 /TAXON_ID=2838 /ORGANISM="Odontella" /LENGTH=113 /DNA_ID=CAMNT_0000503975 /DNA_START=458 /DNA_END=797 /DNA_ORIENTATION=- /assembly_acc=CAM_ASM_000160